MTIEGVEKCKYCGKTAMMFYASSALSGRGKFNTGFCFSCGSKYERTEHNKTHKVGKGVIRFFEKDDDMSSLFDANEDAYALSDTPIDFDVASAAELAQMLTQDELNRLHSITVFHKDDQQISEYVNPGIPEGMYFRYSLTGVPIPV